MLKVAMFILAFLLVGLLTSSLPGSSLPYYWLGSFLQVCHVLPCLLIGQALVLKSPMFILIFTHLTGVILRRILLFNVRHQGDHIKPLSILAGKLEIILFSFGLALMRGVKKWWLEGISIRWRMVLNTDG